ncbi:YfhO family protein [Paraflavitalea pollutisoli]|uniref:YfhO family protein n=1 Tax=Paraflavitalea pollutisoli TaxID=3034143 RepID=UPI0023ED7FFE|nr:YfhO family protein [Paraflavitalea sp. H1-2-19X]
MNKTIWQRLQPHVIAIAGFFLLSVVYCLPLFSGQELGGHDTIGWAAMSHQSIEFKEKYGHLPLWTNSMLSGMPAYQIAFASKYNVTLAHLNSLFTLWLPTPANYFFLNCIGFYLLALVMGARNWIAALGAIGYAFASYSAVIAAVGHISKFGSMGYAPAVLAGLVLLTQRKYIAGFIVAVIATTCMFYQNHIQVMFYTFLIAGFAGLAWLVQAIREKQLKAFLVGGLVFVAAVGLSAGSFAVMLLPSQEYVKETMRGGRSELTPEDKTNKSKGGLNKDYAFNWSYGKLETFTFLVPRLYGGSSPTVVANQYVNELGDHSKVAEVIAEKTGMPEDQAVDFSKQFSPYWGTQGSTSGTVYLGAVICFLFIVGLVFYRQWHLAWILAATAMGILLAWGGNFKDFNYWLFDHLPFYNKFRAPSIALIIPQLTVPLLAVLGLSEILSDKYDKELRWKKFKQSLYITGGVLALMFALYFTLDYAGPADNQYREGLAQQMAQGQQNNPQAQEQAADFANSVVKALRADRGSLLLGDLFRSIIFIVLAAGLLAYYQKKGLSTQLVAIALAILSTIDLFGVDLRYLSHKNYRPADENSELVANRADLQIKQDTGYYRVLDQTSGNPFTDTRAAYFHNSVGGHHAARLALYDDLMQRQLMRGNMQVYNMLNTKYFIVVNPQDRQPIAQMNPDALGATWLVKTIKYVNNADEEMSALDTFNPKDTVIIDKREQSKVPFAPQFDSSGYIKLVKNLNDVINYDFNAATNQFAVFSEVYYPAGWKAFIDGKEAPIVRVNYTLRGLALPAGKHAIEFRFEPAALATGETISLVAGILSILLVLGGIAYMWKKKELV